MIVYIPFNSNDYNSIFSTLSISPRAFYPIRKYSYRRSSETKFNPFDNILIGFDRCIFSLEEFDKDEGYTVYLKLNIGGLKILGNKKGFKSFQIPETIFLYGGFEVVFRTELEKKEVEGRSLKSIETKYSWVAKQNSRVALVSEKANFEKLTISNFNKVNVSSPVDFTKERRFNKVAGALVSNVVGSSESLPPSLKQLKLLGVELNNLSSAYFNNIDDTSNSAIKSGLISCIEEITNTYNEEESIEEAVILGSDSNVNSDLISRLKNGNVFGENMFDLLLEGLFQKYSKVKIEMPIQFCTELSKRRIKSRFNKQYPDSYIKKVKESIEDIQDRIKISLKRASSSNILQAENMLHSNSHFGFEKYSKLKDKEEFYFRTILDFVTQQDNINSVDDLFRNRQEIVTELGKLLSPYKGWKESEERIYLGNLLKSFESLRSNFQIEGISNEPLKCFAIMVTQGRDLTKFISVIEKSNISSMAIAFSIWGGTFGHAGLPKTITEDLISTEKGISIVCELLKESNFGIITEKLEVIKTNSKDITIEKQENKESQISFKSLLLNQSDFAKKKEWIDVMLNCALLVSISQQSSLYSTEDSQVENFKIALKKEKKEKKLKGFGDKKVEIAANIFKEYLSQE